MQTVEAQVVTPFVRAWLRQKTTAGSPHPIRLLHCFDQALNLTDAHGVVISLVSPAIGPGPFAAVLPPLFFRQIAADAPVAVMKDGLRIGAVQVNLRPAAVWQPVPRWRTVSAAQWRAVLPQMAALGNGTPPTAALFHAVQEAAPAGPHGEIRERRASLEEPSGTMPGLLAAWRRNVTPLAAALLARDHRGLQTAVTALAGVGEGLTPAGDDVLLGAILALWAGHPRPQEPATTIARLAAPRTTTLSSAWLRAAAAGAAAVDWHLLLEGVAQEGDKWKTAVSRILSRGHTSGVAALHGFTAVLSALLRAP